jgi:hypothetical protein
LANPKKLVRDPAVATTQLTVLDTMRMAFPRGYVDHSYYRARLSAIQAQRPHGAKMEKEFKSPPATAVDLFAIAGLLLVRSGAYHHVVSNDPTFAAPRTIIVTDVDRESWVLAGKAWRGDGERELPSPPEEVINAWKTLLKHKDDPVFRTGDNWQTAEPWWRAAVALYAIADEAAQDIGFDSGRPKSAQSSYVEAPFRVSLRTTAGAGKKAYSFSRADRDHVCVLPKSRTPGVGCTIRSMSHHLALLPSRSLARAHWVFSSAFDQSESPETAPFNVVVLPMPFGIRASAFEGRPVADSDWGWFDVKPHWCPASQEEGMPDGFEKFAEFVSGVLKKAAEDVGEVHALILPEIALSAQVFRLLADRLKASEGSGKLELLISGLFDIHDGRDGKIRKGNFTGMARFVRFGEGKPPTLNMSIREKHHRWRVDGAQIEAYALGSALDINRKWWEGIDILSRSLDVFVIRGNATVTTLICEDLARNDPCQELVRGIGPNFVVALLMDGPQRNDRWPARYGTVLADDPGSSVLTLTSYGLMRRSNETGRFDTHANQVGLFRDDTGKATELKLPAGAQAICITLQPSPLKEFSMDGRHDNGDAQSWRLGAVLPVSLDKPDAEIMSGDWPASMA